MDQLWELRYLFETSPIALIATAVVVVVVSSYRALLHEIETEKKTEGNDEFVTLDGSQAILIPIVSSISLVVMFYAFAAISQIFAMFCAIICVSSMVFCFSPLAHRIASFIKCRYSKENAVEGKVSLVVISVGVVFLWMVSGHWLLNNLLGTTLCIAFVSHVRLRNLRICSILLISLFFYDIFWVFFSEYFFGANVMVTVASQKAVNPVHTVASHLHLAKSVARKIDLPVKLLIPRNILGSVFSGEVDPREFLMLGLGDMAIPAMFVYLVLSYDNRNQKETSTLPPYSPPQRPSYFWVAIIGYSLGLLSAMAAGTLTRSPQPALLYLVPLTLGPVMFISWRRNEFLSLWNGKLLSDED